MDQKPVKERACVYDIVLNGEVVYVGMTNNPERRLKYHRYTGVAAKGSEMHVFKWFDTREDALSAEGDRQKELTPILCKQIGRREKPKPFDWAAHRKALEDACSKITPEDVEAYLNRESILSLEERVSIQASVRR